ncbi:4-hydroxy-tetrahydrodipicolinate reductase [Thiospirillum jenense]|uniref:4-hydroxy-tetrahydrodipicolinate reductase n=1 Tax=Thiospirillum jenense TaxID=1653858 RepID=A0A839HCG3_9GAMM|nr:dihydrodipicolinate reductase C-terminal domain-containing protein [Thiospirillum jenense]MBB1126224.1 dihydrodipicolinate reductase [Thiospirillum jenense]
MKVGLFGFGRTGKAVASVLLLNKSVHLAWVIRKSNTLQHRSVPEFLGVDSDEPGLIFSKNEWTAARLLDEKPVDAIIDFSAVDGIEFYGHEAAKRNVAIVTAISSYSDEQIALIKQLAELTRILWSPNITIGINFLIIAAKVLKQIAPYTDIEIIEEHFKDKKEVSGTAKIIAHNLDIDPELIKTVRAGGIVGRHEILFGFPYQTVRLTHESITREAFGNGVLFAVTNLIDKKQGFYTMENLLLPYFNQFDPASACVC